MTLAAEVQTRYSAAFLRNLTRPDDPTATTVDTVRLGIACTDAQAEFEDHVGVDLDLTNTMHVNLAVIGVIVKLMEGKSVSADRADKASEAWIKRLDDFCERYGARARIEPKTTGVAVPSEEQVDSETVRPKFDDPLFDDLTPNSPAPGDRNLDDL